MKPQLSKILVYLMLATLGMFLFFWLHQEYKDEQKALQTEYDLQVAKDIFGFNGIDLNSILTKVRGASGEVAIQIDVSNGVYDTTDCHIDDSFRQVQSRMKFQTEQLMNDSAFRSQDSFRIVKHFTQSGNLKDTEGDMTIIVAADNINELRQLDSSQWMASPPLRNILKTGKKGNPQEIRRSALKNIWPQILFAIFLFGLLTFGIYLLQKSYQDQQLLLENKNNLISNITHELKTPVATIGVALEAIQDFNVKDNPQKANSYIDLSRKELARLSSSIDQVMQLSKMDSNTEVYHFEHQDILPLCKEVAQHLDLQIKQKEVRLNITSKQPELKARLDSTHFKSMLFNLIDNSLKYGKTGGYINLNLEENDQQEIELSLSDNGIGIEEKYLAKIFDRFFRVPQGDRHDVKGYGLGLSYVKEIIDVHHWKIKIDSQQNIGTTINIKIPSTNA